MTEAKKITDVLIVNLDELKGQSTLVRQFDLSLENPVTEDQVENYWAAHKRLQNTAVVAWGAVIALLALTPLSGVWMFAVSAAAFFSMLRLWDERKLPVQRFQTKVAPPFSDADLNSIQAATQHDVTIQLFLQDVVERQQRPLYSGETVKLVSRAQTVLTDLRRRNQQEQLLQSLNGGSQTPAE